MDREIQERKGKEKAEEKENEDHFKEGEIAGEEIEEEEEEKGEQLLEFDSRRPFTILSQIDSDLALARTLQEQVSVVQFV